MTYVACVGIGILIGAIMVVLYAVVSYDERIKKNEKERVKDDYNRVIHK